MTGKEIDAAIDTFNLTTCEVLRPPSFAAFIRYIIKQIFPEYLCPITF